MHSRLKSGIADMRQINGFGGCEPTHIIWCCTQRKKNAKTNRQNIKKNQETMRKNSTLMAKIYEAAMNHRKPYRTIQQGKILK